MEFLKLEKIEFGGIKGKVLSAQTVQIFEEFQELYKVFTEFSGDPLDPLDTVSTFMEMNLLEKWQ
jgi:dynein heavy chain